MPETLKELEITGVTIFQGEIHLSLEGGTTITADDFDPTLDLVDWDIGKLDGGQARILEKDGRRWIIAMRRVRPSRLSSMPVKRRAEGGYEFGLRWERNTQERIMIPSIEEARRNRAMRKLQQQQELQRIQQKAETPIDPRTPLILDIVQDLKAEGHETIDVRTVARMLGSSGINDPFKDRCRTVRHILTNDCKIKVVEEWPTILAMPPILPTIKENRIVFEAVEPTEAEVPTVSEAGEPTEAEPEQPVYVTLNPAERKDRMRHFFRGPEAFKEWEERQVAKGRPIK